MDKTAGEFDWISSAPFADDKLADSSPKIDVATLELFSRFEAFNFADDHRFQAGLIRLYGDPNVKRNNAHSSSSPDLLKVKAFYYSKNVEPLDFAAYVRWKGEMKSGQGENQASTPSAAHHSSSGSKTLDTHLAQQGACDMDSQTLQNHQHRLDSTAHEAFGKDTCDKTNRQPSTNVENEPSHIQTDSQASGSDQDHLSNLSSELNCVHISDSSDSNGSVGSSVQQVNMKQNQSEIETGTTISHVQSDKSNTNNTRRDIEQETVVQPDMEGNQDNTEEDTSRVSGDRPAEGEGEQELSFAEIAELIQSGKPIPGLAQVDVVPTNMTPTPSRLHRAKKPWEE